MKKNNNDFYTLINQLQNENQSFKQVYQEYELEKAIIDKIVQIRKSKNVSQRDLAKITGLKQPAIARFESFEVAPNLTTLAKILLALDLKMEITDKNYSNRPVFYCVPPKKTTTYSSDSSCSTTFNTKGEINYEDNEYCG